MEGTVRKISAITTQPSFWLRRPESQIEPRASSASLSIGLVASAAQSCCSSIVVGLSIAPPPSATARCTAFASPPATFSRSERWKTKRMTTKTAITPKISAIVPFGLGSALFALSAIAATRIATTTTPISPNNPDRLNPPAIGITLYAPDGPQTCLYVTFEARRGLLAAAVKAPGVVARHLVKAARDGCLEAGRVVGIEDEVVDDEGIGRVEEVAAAWDSLLGGADDLGWLHFKAEGETGDGPMVGDGDRTA